MTISRHREFDGKMRSFDETHHTPRYKTRVSSAKDLKWLHQFETIECQVDGEVINVEVEDFGDCYDGDEEALRDIDEFLNDHSSENLDIQEFFVHDILRPIEYTLRCGVQDIAKSEDMNGLRKRKTIFLINHVIPSIYHHKNFAELRDIVSRSVTGLLVKIVGLSEVHSADKEDFGRKTSFFRAKEFLGSIALLIWSVY